MVTRAKQLWITYTSSLIEPLEPELVEELDINGERGAQAPTFSLGKLYKTATPLIVFCALTVVAHLRHVFYTNTLLYYMLCVQIFQLYDKCMYEWGCDDDDWLETDWCHSTKPRFSFEVALNMHHFAARANRRQTDLQGTDMLTMYIASQEAHLSAASS